MYFDLDRDDTPTLLVDTTCCGSVYRREPNSTHQAPTTSLLQHDGKGKVPE